MQIGLIILCKWLKNSHENSNVPLDDQNNARVGTRRPPGAQQEQDKDETDSLRPDVDEVVGMIGGGKRIRPLSIKAEHEERGRDSSFVRLFWASSSMHVVALDESYPMKGVAAF